MSAYVAQGLSVKSVESNSKLTSTSLSNPFARKTSICEMDENLPSIRICVGACIGLQEALEILWKKTCQGFEFERALPNSDYAYTPVAKKKLQNV